MRASTIDGSRGSGSRDQRRVFNVLFLLKTTTTNSMVIRRWWRAHRARSCKRVVIKKLLKDDEHGNEMISQKKIWIDAFAGNANLPLLYRSLNARQEEKAVSVRECESCDERHHQVVLPHTFTSLFLMDAGQRLAARLAHNGSYRMHIIVLIMSTCM